jgi:hypothetical protein
MNAVLSVGVAASACWARAGPTGPPAAAAARPVGLAARAHGGAGAGPLAGHRTPPRRAGGQGLGGGGRPGLRGRGPGPGRPGHGLHLVDRRPANCHAMCEALAGARPPGVADTLHQFGPQRGRRLLAHRHARRCTASTSLGAFDASFAAGLLEAARTVRARPGPGAAGGLRRALPRAAARCAAGGRHVAWRWCWCRGAAGGCVWLAGDAAITPCADAALEALRGQIPAARALPLLQALAAPAAATRGARRPDGAALAGEVDAA